MPKIVTDWTRRAECIALASKLADAIYRAELAAPGEGEGADGVWGEVAELSGAIQRRSRQLAGLGRGG